MSPEKIDGIVLERLDKIRKVIEYNGSYVLFPPLGTQRGAVRVQATDMLHVERTVKELMAIVSLMTKSKIDMILTNLVRPILRSIMVAYFE